MIDSLGPPGSGTFAVRRELGGSPAGVGSPLRTWASRAVREPLVHFLLIGLAISVGLHQWQLRDGQFTIRIGTPERQLLESKYVQQYGVQPGPRELATLVADHVHEEILVREALALHLDQDDEIIRRRLVQKYAFLETDLGMPPPPNPDALARWYEAHRESYLAPPRMSFRHVYIAIDTAGPEAARRRALAIAASLKRSPATPRSDPGDPFPGPGELHGLTPDEAVRLFGESEVAEAMFRLPIGSWSGPLRSGYGWHLIHITERLPESLPALSEVRDRVLGDYLEEQRNTATAVQFAALRARYQVRYEDVPR